VEVVHVSTHPLATATTATLFLASLLAWPGASAPALAASSTTFSGRAVVLQGQVAGIPLPTLGDTGPVAPEGGSLHTTLLSYPINGLPDATNGALKAEIVHATVIAQGDRSRARAGVADLQLAAAGQTIGASFLSAQALAVCSNGTATVSASSEIAALTINGQTITVTGSANQNVPLPGLGKIVINEQFTSARAGDGDVTVNALHVALTDPITGKATDVVVASAHADVHCAQNAVGCGPKDFVTGGGWITSTPTGARANFAVAGGDNGWGHLLYIDHGTGPRVKGTGVTAYEVTGLTSRHIEGSAEIDGTPGGSYKVDVADNGEPGRDDTFNLTLSNGYKAGGTLNGGNIQLHCK
jgi:hypothetical protein